MTKVIDSEIVQKMIDKNHQYWKEQAIKEIKERQEQRMNEISSGAAWFILGFATGAMLVGMFWILSGVY